MRTQSRIELHSIASAPPSTPAQAVRTAASGLQSARSSLEISYHRENSQSTDAPPRRLSATRLYTKRIRYRILASKRGRISRAAILAVEPQRGNPKGEANGTALSSNSPNYGAPRPPSCQTLGYTRPKHSEA